MKKLLLIGANGLLGSTLLQKLASIYNVITVTRQSENSDYNLDMSSPILSMDLLNKVQPDLIINLAALTNVDLCEENIELAYQVNTRIAENIADYITSRPQTFTVHISTDHIYTHNNSDEKNISICNIYALTKYCAEKSLNLNNAVILRTNFFGKSLSQNSQGLCDTIYKSANQGATLNLFNDVFFSPLSINTLCDVIQLCLTKKIPGTYNIGSKEGMSKEAFLLSFLEKVNINPIKYNSISIDSLNIKTARPKDMRMNVELFEKTYHYLLPKLTDEIESVANEFKENL